MSNLNFKIVSNFEFLDYEKHFRENQDLQSEDLDVFLKLASTMDFARQRNDSSSLDNVLDLVSEFPDHRNWLDRLLRLMRSIQTIWGGPYKLNLVNKLREPVQYVWAYELHNGLILVEGSTYTAPGATAIFATASASCVDMKQYAVSVWNQDDQEIGRLPTLTVNYINQVERQQGTYKRCEDTIEVG